MTTIINGYIVVRLPYHNKDYLGGRGIYSTYAPKLFETFYGGIERMPWFDVQEEFYAGRLPEDIKRQWLSIKEENRDLPGISLTSSLDVGLSLLAYSNRVQIRNELIAVYSKELINYKSVVEISDNTISWLGYDVVALPEWSILKAGIFYTEKVFHSWKEFINEHGLFTSILSIEGYVQAYEEAALKGQVEELWRLDQIAYIKIGRVQH